jgi:ssDNA-binding Zn-finger/Zn-ribbon topoisomerase 1
MPLHVSNVQDEKRTSKPRQSYAAHRDDERQLEDLIMPARCPLCGHYLVARQGTGGPYFYCSCKKAA